MHRSGSIVAYRPIIFLEDVFGILLNLYTKLGWFTYIWNMFLYMKFGWFASLIKLPFQIAYAFPKVTLLTSAIDSQISDQFHILPGLGNFGDRYFGTDSVADDELEGDEDCSSHCDHFVN